MRERRKKTDQNWCLRPRRTSGLPSIADIPLHRREPPIRARSGSHSITSWAPASSEGGTVRPRPLTVLRLMVKSNLLGACTGKFVGLSPFRIRSTCHSARWIRTGSKSFPAAAHPPQRQLRHGPASRDRRASSTQMPSAHKLAPVGSLRFNRA
jgi:hypothetical protein